MQEYRFNPTLRNLYTYLLNLSKRQGHLAFARTKTIANHVGISQSQVNKYLKLLISFDLILCVDKKKNVRYFRVFENKKLCISKEKLDQHRQKPIRIRQKTSTKSCSKLPFLETDKRAAFETLARRSGDLSASISGERIESLKEYVYKNKSDFRTMWKTEDAKTYRPKQTVEEWRNELFKKYPVDLVNEVLDYIRARGYGKKVKNAQKYLQVCLEKAQAEKQKRAQLLLNKKLLERKLKMRENFDPNVCFFLGKTSLMLQSYSTGEAKKISLYGSPELVDFEIQEVLKEYQVKRASL